MKLDDEDRPVRVLESYSRPFLSAALVVVVACVAAFAFLPEFGDYAKGLVFALGDAVGIRPPEDEYSAAYKRLGISPLPAKLLASSKISSSLARLAREPCDKAAILAFGEALLAAHEGRKAETPILLYRHLSQRRRRTKPRRANPFPTRRQRESHCDHRCLGREESHYRVLSLSARQGACQCEALC
jgi:hypothetical protein